MLPGEVIEGKRTQCFLELFLARTHAFVVTLQIIFTHARKIGKRENFVLNCRYNNVAFI